MHCASAVAVDTQLGCMAGGSGSYYCCRLPGCTVQVEELETATVYEQIVAGCMLEVSVQDSLAAADTAHTADYMQ